MRKLTGLLLLLALLHLSCQSKISNLKLDGNKLVLDSEVLLIFDELSGEVLVQDTINSFEEKYWNSRDQILKLILDTTKTEFSLCSDPELMMMRGDIVFLMMCRCEKLPYAKTFNFQLDVYKLPCGSPQGEVVCIQRNRAHIYEVLSGIGRNQ
jgi:hypothetical protein